ncbi:MAG: exosortase/archaeosortase family protein [Armatimonadota bacterium]
MTASLFNWVRRNRLLTVGTFLVLILTWFSYELTFEYWWLIWGDKRGYYSHGYLVPFLAGYIIYMNRGLLTAEKIKSTLWGLPWIFVAIVLAVMARLSASSAISAGSILFMTVGAVLLLFGRKWMRVLWFPILYCGLMVPWPNTVFDEISFPIQQLSTEVAARILSPIYETTRNGILISLPGYELLVGAPCSGFKIGISMLTFATFFAIYTGLPKWKQVLLVIISQPLALLINGVRIAAIGVAGVKWGSAVANEVHDYGGYVVIIIALAILFLIGRWFGWQTDAPQKKA